MTEKIIDMMSKFISMPKLDVAADIIVSTAMDILPNSHLGYIVLIERTTRNNMLKIKGLNSTSTSSNVEKIEASYDRHEGVIYHTIRDGVPIWGNVDTFSSYVECSSSVKSEIAVPIISGGRTIGAINIESNISDNYSEEHVAGLTKLATYAAIIFQNIKPLESLIETIDKLTQTNHNELDKVLSIIADGVATLLNVEIVSIMIQGNNNKDLNVIYPKDDTFFEMQCNINNSIPGRVFNKRDLHTEFDVSKSHYLQHQKVAIEKKWGSYIGAPLIDRSNNVFGVINANTSQEELSTFSECECHYFIVLARYASAAIKYSYDFNELETIRILNLELAATTNFADVMPIISSYFQSMNADSVILRTLNTKNTALELVEDFGYGPYKRYLTTIGHKYKKCSLKSNPPNKPLCVLAMQRREPVIMRRQTSPICVEIDKTDPLVLEHIKEIASFPIIIDGGVVAVISVQSSWVNFFNQLRVTQINNVINSIPVAIKNTLFSKFAETLFQSSTHTLRALEDRLNELKKTIIRKDDINYEKN